MTKTTRTPSDERGTEEADEATLGLDPFRVLNVAAETARGDLEAESIFTYLDLERRVVFDLTDRVVPDGPELTAQARTRQQDILDALESGDAVDEVLEDHVDHEQTELYPRLLGALDDAGREDLAAAFEEARLSREESDQDLPVRDEDRHEV